MTSATVTKLPTAKRPARKAPAIKRDAKPSRASIRQQRMGYAFGGLAFSLTALSLSHLAEGVTMVAHRARWEGWSVATAIDIGFIAAEVMPFMVTAECLRDTKIARYGFSACVLAASATFNAMAFSEAATSPAMRFAAMALGVAMPAAIATLTHFASRCVIGKAH